MKQIISTIILLLALTGPASAQDSAYQQCSAPGWTHQETAPYFFSGPLRWGYLEFSIPVASDDEGPQSFIVYLKAGRLREYGKGHLSGREAIAVSGLRRVTFGDQDYLLIGARLTLDFTHNGGMGVSHNVLKASLCYR